MSKYTFVAISVVVIVLWIVNPFIVNYYFSDLEKAGHFADTYNIISSLYAGLGFAAIIYTIGIQKKELQNEITAVNKTNKLSYLTALLTYYSGEEEKYMGNDAEKCVDAKLKKENIITLIDNELRNEE